MNSDNDELTNLLMLKNYHKSVTATTQVVTNLKAFELLFK